ncbi:MAG: class I SAM-dependent methyltransferase [Parvularculaceae bacterium]
MAGERGIAGDLATGAKRAFYSASQMARIAWYTGHYMAGRRKMGPLTRPGEAPYAEEFAPLDRARLKSAFSELFKADWRNIEAGLYKMPLELRRPPSPATLAKLSRDYLKDTESVARRKHHHIHSEVLSAEASEKYPRYYLQNFHYQSDGWLSAESAARYDMQVETLFTGAAAAMRRQTLPFIRKAIAEYEEGGDEENISLVDIACGAGGYLETILDNWPRLRATGLDLSPAYLSLARRLLKRYRHVSLVEGKAEAMNFADASFNVATAVYLFHELPPKVRDEAALEIARILKPGGTFILADTIQYGDEPGLDVLLENFPRGFHEPYYDSYCRLDLETHFAKAGLEKCGETVAFLTKVTAFRKES